MLRFQSTFPRGERRFLRGGSRLVSYFNPRSLVGNDVLRRAACPLLFYFNPRSLVGNDIGRRAFLMELDEFQSTFPRGERRSTSKEARHTEYFNPRSLVGNDEVADVQGAAVCNFNPRSLVGNDGKFSQIFFVFLCNKYNFSTFYYPFSLFFSVIHVTFLIFVVRILPAFYVYF